MNRDSNPSAVAGEEEVVLMRRIGVVLGVAVVIAAAVALAAGTALAQAETETSIRREPFAFIYDNRCTGEPMLIEGTFQQVTHTTLNENGHHVASSSHIRISARTSKPRTPAV